MGTSDTSNNNCNYNYNNPATGGGAGAAVKPAAPPPPPPATGGGALAKPTTSATGSRIRSLSRSLFGTPEPGATGGGAQAKPTTSKGGNDPTRAAFWEDYRSAKQGGGQQGAIERYKASKAAKGEPIDRRMHAAHKISKEEMAALHGHKSRAECEALRAKFHATGVGNYRMSNAYTNQSVHMKIDKMLIKHNKDGTAITATTTEGGKGTHIPIGEILDRIEQKIDIAKEMGDDTTLAFLKKAAINANLSATKENKIDIRRFNGLELGAGAKVTADAKAKAAKVKADKAKADKVKADKVKADKTKADKTKADKTKADKTKAATAAKAKVDAAAATAKAQRAAQQRETQRAAELQAACSGYYGGGGGYYGGGGGGGYGGGGYGYGGGGGGGGGGFGTCLDGSRDMRCSMNQGYSKYG
jgi:membrane protein involved in colicin uptake